MSKPHNDLEDAAILANYLEINRLAYDALSDEYLKRAEVRSIYETPASELVNSILIYANSTHSLSVLEVGPGSGQAVKHFEAKSCRTTAVDISENVISIAKVNSPNTIFIHANILDVNFSENQFDIIFAGALIHLFPKIEAERLIGKFVYWLKNDGILFISTTKSEKSEEGFFTKVDYHNPVNRFRKKWIEPEFNEFVSRDFKILETIYTDEKDRNKKWIGYICRLENGK